MDAYIISISRQTLYLTLILSAPPVGAALIVGLVISLLQATTQVQEQTLTFVPKLIITIIVIAVLGPWGFYQLISFTTSLFSSIPTYFGQDMQQVFDNLGYHVDWFHSMMVGSLILTRFVIVVNLVPFLFGRPVPAMLRQIIALLFTLLMYPVVIKGVPQGIETNQLLVLALFAKEILYGMAIGLAAAMIFYGFDAAGQVIDAQRGASMAQIFSPQTGRQVTVFAQFSLQLGIVLFLSLGGHRLFLHSLFDSFRLLPIYELPHMGGGFLEMIDLFIRISGDVLLIATQLAAPILISIFVCDLILGVMNRISPAVNVLTLGFIIRGIMGVLIFFISLGVIAHQMGLLSVESMQNVTQTLHFLASQQGLASPPPQAELVEPPPLTRVARQVAAAPT